MHPAENAPQNEPDRLWHVLAADAKPYGPYTDGEMLEFVQTGRVVPTTAVAHPHYTGGKWAEASTVDWLSRRFPIPTDEGEPHPSQSQEEATLPLPRSRPLRVREGRSGVELILDFIDPTFKYYVTPAIISVTWTIFLVLTVLSFVLITIATIPGIQLGEGRPAPPINFPIQAPPVQAPNQSIVWLMFTVFRWVATGLAVLWTRVVLETFIAVFHISMSLRSINELTQRRLA